VTIWDVDSGMRVKSMLLRGEGSGAAVFSPDGKQFAVVSLKPKHKITFYGLDGNEQFTIDHIPRRVWSLAFTPDGTKLIGALEDTSALVWDLTSLQNK
jgi:WD40 repeat protein